MSFENSLATLRDIANVLLMSMPGFLTVMLLPLARAAHPGTSSREWQKRTVVWTILCLLTIAILIPATLLILVGTPTLERIFAIAIPPIVAGTLYILVGGDPIARSITQFNRALLKLAGYLALACSLVMLANVVTRYVFAAGFGWASETVVYCYAACFMLGAAGTLAHDGHVRIDILRNKMPTHIKARTELLGSLLLLVPVMTLTLSVYAPQLALAWGAGSGHLETSDEGDGLPLAFAFKSLIPLFAITMIMQGWASAWNAGAQIHAKKPRST